MTTNLSADEIADLVRYLNDEERAELDSLLAGAPVWTPMEGPQMLAYLSDADVIGYGGAAGGGKTDLAIGKAITQHQIVQIFRREGTELTSIIDRAEQVLGHREGLGGKPPIWREPYGSCRMIEFCSAPNLGDERKFQGRAKDLLVFDEATNFLEEQIRFMMIWVRSVDPNQKCQTLLTFNPPVSSEGQWVIQFFAPWLDDTHPCPADPGELRWFAMIDSKEREVPDDRRFVIVDGKPRYEFDASRYRPEEIVTPKSRTFIPARVTDNPHLAGTGYMATLQALPEPLRSQMLYGDFKAGMQDDPWQVIPTAWVEAAMDRWKPMDKKPRMTSLGVDVARGGADNTIIARRHDMWFDELLAYPGKQTPDGPSVAGLAIAANRDHAPIHIDVIGVGASPYDFLKSANQQVTGVNVAEAATGTDRSGRLGFANLRSQLWWRMREALDPQYNTGIALPRDRQLLLDLCAPTWQLRGPNIQVESREDIVKRIGRSPDWASALCLALIDTPRIRDIDRSRTDNVKGRDYHPLAAFRPSTRR